MPYQQNIPLPTDQLDDSQGDIQGNFQEIYNLVGINHVQFGAAAGQGKHTQVTLPENAAPTPTLINEANIYSRNSGTTGVTELAWQRENNGDIIEWTARQQIGAAGWTRLPSGIMLKWQNVLINAVDANNGTIVTTWAGIGPAFVVQYFALVNPAADPGDINKDVNAIAYITSTANPAQVSYTLWRRNLFNTIGTNQGPLNVNILAIGL